MPGITGETADLIVRLNLDDRGFSGKINRIGSQLNRLDSGLSQVGRGVGQVGGGLVRVGEVAAVAAAGGLAAVITTAASFEQAFTGVEKTVEGTDAQLAELESTFRQMARTMPVSFESLAAIGEAGGALGVARDSLDEFTDVVARLAVSTDLSTDQAATALGQLGNVLHLSEEDFEDFADSLVALGNAGASTESQIVEMAARFGAAGNSAGLSKEEILALSSAVASMGIQVEAGGSSLSRLFGNVTTAIATGSDDVEAFTKLLGISADELQEQWGDDALGTFQNFLEELSKLDQFAQARVLEEAGITNIRDINAVRLMAQNVGFLEDQLGIAEGAQGALGEESDKFFATTQGQWQILKNNVRDAAAVIGTDLLPVVNDLIADFLGFLNQPGTQAGLAEFAQDLAAGVRGFAEEMKGTDFSGIIGGIKLAAGAAKVAFDAFRTLPEPVQQLAVAALVANRVTGGAVGQIAKGLANIFGGALRTITAANVTVVGANVTGGVPAAPVAGGGGRVGRAARVGGGALALVGLPLLANEIGKAINEASGVSDEELKAAVDNSWWGIATATNTDVIRDEVASAASHDAVMLGHAISAEATRQRQLDEARGADVALINSARMQTDRLQESLSVARAAESHDRVLLQTASRANSLHSRTAGASEITSRKDFSPTLHNNITIPVSMSVNAALVQQRIHQIRTTTGGGGFI